jgi:hypothetical protein
MFNALTPTELLIGIGRILRMVADCNGELEGFQRSQILSALSVTRLLASEQLAAADLFEQTRVELLAALDHDNRSQAAAARARISAARSGAAIGDAVGDLLEVLPRPDPLRTGVQAALRAMADREVAALARAAA